MVKCITLEHPDGSVSTRGGFGPKFLARFNGDVDAALQYVMDELVPIQNPGVEARIEDVEFPADKDFRMAWVRGTGKIDVDMPQARVIHMDRIREARAPKLVEADNEVKKAEDAGNAAALAKARAKRQKLRDIPQSFDLSGATTPDELKALWPSELD